jgi:RHS repeat-associated protein
MTTIPETYIRGTSSYTLKYDAWNRMVEAKESSTVLGTYAYDGLNRRTSKTAGGVTYHYYYNENWQVLETRQGSDPDPWEQNVWHTYYIDALALRHYAASVGGTQVTHYFAHDANYNHTAVFDTSKNVIERYWYYTAYGDPGVLDANYTGDSDGLSDIANATTYTGRSLDTETGLYYYRNRYYHAQLGRFVGRDPIVYFAGSLSIYGYANGSPGTNTDPSGTIVIVPRFTGQLPPPPLNPGDGNPTDEPVSPPDRPIDDGGIDLSPPGGDIFIGLGAGIWNYQLPIPAANPFGCLSLTRQVANCRVGATVASIPVVPGGCNGFDPRNDWIAAAVVNHRLQPIVRLTIPCAQPKKCCYDFEYTNIYASTKIVPIPRLASPWDRRPRCIALVWMRCDVTDAISVGRCK